MSTEDLQTWIQLLNDLPALAWFMAVYVLLELAVEVGKRNPLWLLRLPASARPPFMGSGQSVAGAAVW